MRRSLIAACGILALCGGVVLLAGASEAQAQDAGGGDGEGRWSVGAGVGYTGWVESSVGVGSLSGLGGLGGLTGLSGLGGLGVSGPQVGGLVEYRSSPSWAWAFVVDGAYVARAQGDASATDARLQASVGGRYVFNPGALVEVSGLVLGFGTYGASEAELRAVGADDSAPLTRQRADNVGGGVTLGLVAERELMERVWLRVGSQLAQVSYHRSQGEQDGAELEPATALRAGVMVVPSVALRLHF